LSRQPWSIRRTEGFDKILNYWKGNGTKPSKQQARRWLFEQARKTRTRYCDFLPGMVKSLHPLDPMDYLEKIGTKKPAIIQQPQNMEIQTGFGAIMQVKASGYPLEYQWYRNGMLLTKGNSFQLFLHNLPLDERMGNYHVIISNEKGRIQSETASVTVKPFDGYVIDRATSKPEINSKRDTFWDGKQKIDISNIVVGNRETPEDLTGWFSVSYDMDNLYFFVRVYDDYISTNASIDYLKDGIEIYLDADNSKSTFYGEDEYQLRFVVDDSTITSAIGADITGVLCSQSRVADGYQMEISLPWKNISKTGKPNGFLGLDVHINDNDGKTRNGKLAWWAKRDNSYQTPGVFGTVRLGE